MRIIFILLLLCATQVSFSQNVEKKITPAELAQVIVDVLEELRHDLEKNQLLFSDSELEISALKSFEGGAKISVWVAKVGMDVTKETSLTVSYQLSKLLQEAQIETNTLAFLEKSFSPVITDPRMKSQNLSELKTFKFETEEFKGLEKVQSYNEALSIVEAVKKRRAKARKIVNAKTALVESIKQTIDDYKKMKEQFGEVKFDVKIAFSIEYTPGAEIEIGIFGAEAKGTKGWEHSIKLSFGSKN